MPPRAPKKTEAARRREIERYLQTGDNDEYYSCWPGSNFLECVEEGDRVLRAALIAEVRRRAGDRRPPSLPRRFDPRRFARRQVTPMVEGLFPAKERPVILELLGSSLVFLTPENIADVLASEQDLSSAWDQANLYLGSLGCPGLDDRPVRHVGMSEATTCLVSTTYFEVVDPFADYVVHEAAHIFHDWKRERVGLPYSRYRAWLLEIDIHKRETFAYACEAYSRIRERSRGLADRKRLHAEYAESWAPSADHLDSNELVDILGEAVAARNGWKRILARCSPPKRARVGRSPRGG